MDRHLESLPLFEEEVNTYNTTTNNTTTTTNNSEYEYTKGSSFGTDYRNSNTYLRGKNVAQLVRGGGGASLPHTTTNNNTTPILPLPPSTPAPVSTSQVEVAQQQQHAQSSQVASGNPTSEGGGGGGGEAHLQRLASTDSQLTLDCTLLHVDCSTDMHKDHCIHIQPTVDNNNNNNSSSAMAPIYTSTSTTVDRSCSVNEVHIADTHAFLHPTTTELPPQQHPDQSVYSEVDILTVYTNTTPVAPSTTDTTAAQDHSYTTTSTHEPQQPQHPPPTTATPPTTPTPTHTNNTIQFEQPQLGFKGAMAMMAELSKAVSRLKDDLFMFYFTDPNPATACALDQNSASAPVSGLPLYTSTMDTGDGDGGCSLHTHPTTTMSCDGDDEDDVFSLLEQHQHEQEQGEGEEVEGSDEQHNIMNSCNNSTTATTRAPTTPTAVPTTANTTSNTTGRSRRGRKKGSGTGSRHIHTRHAKLHEYERDYITPHCLSLLTTSITSTDTTDPDSTILSPFVDSRHTFLGRHLLHIYDVTLYISIYMLHLLYIQFIFINTILTYTVYLKNPTQLYYIYTY